MRLIFCLLLFVLVLLLLVVCVVIFVNVLLVEGKDYECIVQLGLFQLLVGKIEVVEVFGYICLYCVYFELQLEVWVVKLLVDVCFILVLVVFGGVWDVWVLVYYVVEEVGVVKCSYVVVFKVLYEQGLLLMQNVLVDEFVIFYKVYGVILDCYIQVLCGDVVQKKVEVVCVFVQCIKILGILVIIINGQYLVCGNSFDDQLCIVFVLIVQVCVVRGC